MRDPNTLIDVSDVLDNGLSGGVFPVSVLPRFLLPISMAIALTCGHDAVRGYLLRTETSLPPGIEMPILLGSMLVIVPLGYLILCWSSGAAARCARWGRIDACPLGRPAYRLTIRCIGW